MRKNDTYKNAFAHALNAKTIALLFLSLEHFTAHASNA